MATETVFTFPSDNSDSDGSDDNENLIFEKGEGHIRQSNCYKQTFESRDVQADGALDGSPSDKTPHKSHTGNGTHKISKEVEREALEILSEKRELLFKRRAIIYQLMATGAIVMLHGISYLPYFLNNSLMNIRTLTEQTATQWSVLLCYCISCFYTPSFLYRVQMKWTMAAGCLIAAVFSVARFYPSIYVLVPAGILLGLSLGPFYTAANRHVARLASTYEGYQGNRYEETVVTFTSVFFACTCFSPVWISLLHIVLFDMNGDAIFNPQQLVLPDGECGFYYLWNLFTPIGQRNGLAPELHNTMAAQLGSCLICTIGGVVLAITSLGDIPFPKTGNALISQSKVTDEVREVTKQVKDSNLLLLFPVYMCVGFLETFCYTIYVQAFVYCFLGANNIYYSTMATAVCSLLTCVLLGFMASRISRPKLTLPMYFITLLFIVLAVVAGDVMPWVYYIIAGLLGVATVILSSQIHAMTSQEFYNNLEVAHALLCFGKSVAYLIAFILIRYHGDNSTITGAVMGTCVIAFLCHLILEIRLKLTDKSQNENTSSGAYVLLEQPRWIPSVDPKTVRSDTKHLMGRIPQVSEKTNSSK